MTDLDPTDYALDTALVPEKDPIQPDFTEPDLAGDLDPEQTPDFAVIDPETGVDTDDLADPTDPTPDTTPDATSKAGD